MIRLDDGEDEPFFVAREIHRDLPPINGLERYLQHRHLRRRWPISRPTVAGTDERTSP